MLFLVRNLGPKATAFLTQLPCLLQPSSLSFVLVTGRGVFFLAGQRAEQGLIFLGSLDKSTQEMDLPVRLVEKQGVGHSRVSRAQSLRIPGTPEEQMMKKSDGGFVFCQVTGSSVCVCVCVESV